MEHILDVLVPDMVEQLVKLPNTEPQDRVRQRFVEQTDETPDFSLAENIVEGPVTQTQGETQQAVNTRVQHVVDTVETAEVPLLQFTVKVVDIPVVAQRQICVNQKVQKTMEDLHLQYTDGVVNVPVVLVVLVPQVQVVTETAEIPQLQVVKKMGVTPETVQTPQLLSDMQVPQEHIVPKTVEIPKLPFDGKIVVIPRINTVQGFQTSESLNGEFDAGHDEKTEQDALAEGVVFEVKQQTRQQHKQRATTQTAQEEERGSEGRAVREGEKKKGGQVEKEQGREEREKGRKGQRGRGQEGRKKEEREAEEEECKQVEKDVTGWTEVTRKKKKMVQKFVKVDGGKTSAMEMEMSDKVDDIVKKIPISDQDVYVTSGGRILR